jgi:hypothetical protein
MPQKPKMTDFLLTTGAHRHRPVQPAEISRPFGTDPRGDQEQLGRTTGTTVSGTAVHGLDPV